MFTKYIYFVTCKDGRIETIVENPMVSCICDLLWRNREQVGPRQVSHLKVGINSAGYFCPTQSPRAFLSRSRGIPFQFQRLTLTIPLLTHFMDDCVYCLRCLTECIGEGLYWSCNTVQQKGETSA